MRTKTHSCTQGSKSSTMDSSQSSQQQENQPDGSETSGGRISRKAANSARKLFSELACRGRVWKTEVHDDKPGGKHGNMKKKSTDHVAHKAKDNVESACNNTGSYPKPPKIKSQAVVRVKRLTETEGKKWTRNYKNFADVENITLEGNRRHADKYDTQKNSPISSTITSEIDAKKPVEEEHRYFKDPATEETGDWTENKGKDNSGETFSDSLNSFVNVTQDSAISKMVADLLNAEDVISEDSSEPFFCTITAIPSRFLDLMATYKVESITASCGVEAFMTSSKQFVLKGTWNNVEKARNQLLEKKQEQPPLVSKRKSKSPSFPARKKLKSEASSSSAAQDEAASDDGGVSLYDAVTCEADGNDSDGEYNEGDSMEDHDLNTKDMVTKSYALEDAKHSVPKSGEKIDVISIEDEDKVAVTSESPTNEMDNQNDKPAAKRSSEPRIKKSSKTTTPNTQNDKKPEEEENFVELIDARQIYLLSLPSVIDDFRSQNSVEVECPVCHRPCDNLKGFRSHFVGSHPDRTDRAELELQLIASIQEQEQSQDTQSYNYSEDVANPIYNFNEEEIERVSSLEASVVLNGTSQISVSGISNNSAGCDMTISGKKPDMVKSPPSDESGDNKNKALETEENLIQTGIYGTHTDHPPPVIYTSIKIEQKEDQPGNKAVNSEEEIPRVKVEDPALNIKCEPDVPLVFASETQEVKFRLYTKEDLQKLPPGQHPNPYLCIYQCTQCCMRGTLSALKSHIARGHPAHQAKCPHCSCRALKDQTILGKHMLKKHRTLVPRVVGVPEEDVKLYIQRLGDKCVRASKYRYKQKLKESLEKAKVYNHSLEVSNNDNSAEKDPSAKGMPKNRRRNIQKLEIVECKKCGFADHAVKMKGHNAHLTSTPFLCTVCLRILPSERELKIHKQLNHFDKKDGKMKLSKQAPDEKKHFCKICGLGFSSALACSSHRRIHIKGEREAFKNRLPETAEKRDKREETLHICDKCPYTTTKYSQLQNHVARMHSDRLFKCSECPKSFGLKSDMEYHFHENHTGRREIVCDECGAKLKSKRKLTMHIKNLHTEKKVECDLCPMKFISEGRLRLHKKVHRPDWEKDREKEKCPKCGKLMAKSSMKIHLQTHKTTNDYVCSICQKSFNLKHKLAYHEKLHGPPTLHCPHKGCKRKFHFKVKLRYHMARHSSEGVFVCKKCNNVYASERYLMFHRCQTSWMANKHKTGQKHHTHSKEVPLDSNSLSSEVFQDSDSIMSSIHEYETEKESAASMLSSMLATETSDPSDTTGYELQHFMCSVCKKVYPSFSAISAHLLEHREAASNADQLYMDELG